MSDDVLGRGSVRRLQALRIGGEPVHHRVPVLRPPAAPPRAEAAARERARRAARAAACSAGSALAPAAAKRLRASARPSRLSVARVGRRDRRRARTRRSRSSRRAACVWVLLRAGYVSADKLVVDRPAARRLVEALHQPVRYLNGWYAFVTLIVIAIFGWLLERRHGPLVVLALFLGAGAAGALVAIAVYPLAVVIGGNAGRARAARGLGGARPARGARRRLLRGRPARRRCARGAAARDPVRARSEASWLAGVDRRRARAARRARAGAPASTQRREQPQGIAVTRVSRSNGPYDCGRMTMTNAVVLIEAERDALSTLGGALADIDGRRRGLLGHGRVGLRRDRARARPRAARRRRDGARSAGCRACAHADDGRVRGLLAPRSRSAVLDRRVGAATMVAVPIKPEYGPTLGRLLSPRWRAASPLARGLVRVCVAGVRRAGDRRLPDARERALLPRRQRVPFSFSYRGLYRVAPAARRVREARAPRAQTAGWRTPSRSSRSMLPPYSGALTGALPLYAAGYIRALRSQRRGLRAARRGQDARQHRAGLPSDLHDARRRAHDVRARRAAARRNARARAKA